MPDISGTLARIDAVVGCHQCGGELGASPSDVFCSEECAMTWAAHRVGAEVSDDLSECLLGLVRDAIEDARRELACLDLAEEQVDLHAQALAFGQSYYVVPRGTILDDEDPPADMTGWTETGWIGESRSADSFLDWPRYGYASGGIVPSSYARRWFLDGSA